jgi:hypothetical protein
MRISVVYDDHGEILAATPAGEGADEFLPAEGESVAELDSPEGVAEDELQQLFQHFSVDVDTTTLKQASSRKGARLGHMAGPASP